MLQSTSRHLGCVKAVPFVSPALRISARRLQAMMRDSKKFTDAVEAYQKASTCYMEVHASSILAAYRLPAACRMPLGVPRAGMGRLAKKSVGATSVPREGHAPPAPLQYPLQLAEAYGCR